MKTHGLSGRHPRPKDALLVGISGESDPTTSSRPTDVEGKSAFRAYFQLFGDKDSNLDSQIQSLASCR
jgi:hypothetical protein